MKIENYIYIILIMFWPFVIINKSIFFAVTVGLFLLVFVRNYRLNTNRILQLIGIIVLIHFMSIILFMATKGSDTTRVVAAVNTALCWLNAGIVYTIIYTAIRQNEYFSNEKIHRYGLFNLFVLLALTLIAVLMMRKGQNIILLGRDLVKPDWVNGVRMSRISLFMEYCSLVTCFVLINMSLVLRNKIDKKRLLLILLCFLPVYYSKSRICIFAYIIYMAIVFLGFIKDKTKYYKVTVFIVALAAIMLVILSMGDIYETINDIFYARANSTIRRMEIYTLSVKNMWETNPLIGCGIKTIYRDSIPFGSHSTYIGALYKVGLLGFGFSVLLIKEICARIKHNGSLIDWALFIAFAIIMIFEDADGTNWLVFYMFTYLGIMHNAGVNKKIGDL